MSFQIHIRNINILFVLLIITFFCTLKANSQNKESEHELTVYVMPTMHPLDWGSPAKLYKSMMSCYVKTITLPDNYLLGHLSVRLKTSLLDKPIYIAQTSGSLQEKLDLVLKQKVGFGILGAPMQGRIETADEINHKLAVYTKRNKLSFIRYKINEAAAARMMKFMQQYSAKMNEKYSPSDFYGGSFWPLYHGEGAGCTAFGMALLDLVDILPGESSEWYVNVKIPISIIGGEFNDNKKIKIRTIKRTDSWYIGDGQPNVDYVEHLLYDPSIMFNWIEAKRMANDSVYLPINDGVVPGLMVDATHVQFNPERPIFRERTRPNLFIDKYFEKLKALD